MVWSKQSASGEEGRSLSEVAAACDGDLGAEKQTILLFSAVGGSSGEEEDEEA